MTEKEINLLVGLESLHRYVFDEIYVQNYDITDEDRNTLKVYWELREKYPNFRSNLYLLNPERYKRYKTK